MLTLARPKNRARQEAGDCLLDAYATTREELVGALTRMLGSPEDALDAAQTTFLKCWRTRGRLGTVRDLKAWIFRVGLNAGRDLRRDAWRRRSRPLTVLPDDQVAHPDSPFDSECLGRLRDAVDQLRPAEREVFLLRQDSDYTYEEIAAMCRVPVGTVKTRMRSALFKLQGALREPEPCDGRPLSPSHPGTENGE